MTKTQDQLILDASKAADLIKTTTETTTTALNIKYIQKDISEIKESMKTLTANSDCKLDDLQNQLNVLSKIVYMGLGASAIISLGLKFFVK